MIEPPMPSSGMNVLDWSMKVWRYLRATAPRAGPGLQSTESSSGTILSLRAVPASTAAAENPPFKLTVSQDGADWQWTVAQDRSSVYDGTNGDAVDLGPSGAAWAAGAIQFEALTDISATKYIVLQADVAESTLALTDWTLAAVDAADADEVGTDTTGTPFQDKLSLLIGKVTYTAASGGDPASAIASQAVFTPQMINYALLNGMACKVFQSAPLHKNNL